MLVCQIQVIKLKAISKKLPIYQFYRNIISEKYTINLYFNPLNSTIVNIYIMGQTCPMVSMLPVSFYQGLFVNREMPCNNFNEY